MTGVRSRRSESKVEAVLGVDVGSLVCRVLVLGLDGKVLGKASQPMPWRSIGAGTELDPRELHSVVFSTIELSLESIPEAVLRAIGIAGVAESGVLVDAGLQPLAPALAWHDPRGGTESSELLRAIGWEAFCGHTGIPVSTLCSLVKYKWFRRNLDETDEGVQWLSLPEWAAVQLGGAPVSELSLASRTGFLDVLKREPLEAALEWAQAPKLLGELVGAGTPIGTVAPERAPAQLAGAVITVAGHDDPCATVGAGATAPEALFDSAGSAEAFLRTVDPERVGPGDLVRAVGTGVTIGCHVVPDHLYSLGAHWSGLALERLKAILEEMGHNYDAVERDADDAAPVISDASRFGRFPVELDDLRHIVANYGAAGATRFLVERISANTERIVLALENLSGPAACVIVGGERLPSELLSKLRAQLFGIAIKRAGRSCTAIGAAILAGQAAGLTIDRPEVKRTSDPLSAI